MPNTAAGTRIYIGPTSSATTVSQFAALSYTEINDVESIGEFGDQSNIVTASTLKDGRVRKAKGTKDAGDLQVTLLVNNVDTGQNAVRTAYNEQTLNYAFKIVEPDKITGSGSGTVSYFLGKVTSVRKTMAGVDEYVRSNANIAIDSAVLQVSPT